MDFNAFFDFQTTLDKYYQPLEKGNTTRTHIFSIHSLKQRKQIIVLYKQDDISCIKIPDSLLLTKRNKVATFLEPVKRKEKIKGLLDEFKNCDVPG